jgi:hypothetical protein
MPKEKEKVHADCERCGKSFEQKRVWQKYCSQVCRQKVWAEDHPRAAADLRAEIEEAYQRGARDARRQYWRERKKAQREKRRGAAAT